jgi:hypothetical protein
MGCFGGVDLVEGDFEKNCGGNGVVGGFFLLREV